MLRIDRAIQLINQYISTSDNEVVAKLFPIKYEELLNNPTLCETLIEFIGDIYQFSGLDADYNETPAGSQLQQLITFLASLVPENPS